MATHRDLKIPAQRHPEKQRRADAPQPKKPDWIRFKAPVGEGYKNTYEIMREHKLVTVCDEAGVLLFTQQKKHEESNAKEEYKFKHIGLSLKRYASYAYS